MESTPEVFISYRFNDSAAMASRIHAYLTIALRNSIHPNPVFLDNHDVPPGAELRRDIWRYLNKADVLLVLIGKSWLSLAEVGSDRPRIFDPDDFLREEIDYGIKEAIAGDMYLIPVLVNDALMPRPTELPHDIIDLTNYKGVHISDENFEVDMQMLLAQIKIYLQKADVVDLEESALNIRQYRAEKPDEIHNSTTQLARPTGLGYDEPLNDNEDQHVAFSAKESGSGSTTNTTGKFITNDLIAAVFVVSVVVLMTLILVSLYSDYWLRSG